MSWRVQGCEVYCTSISRTQGSTATTTAGGGAGGGSALAAAAGYEGPCGNHAAHIVVHTENTPTGPEDCSAEWRAALVKTGALWRSTPATMLA